MATAWIDLPYDHESRKTPWGPVAQIMAAVNGLGYGVERVVMLGSRREFLRLRA